MGRLKGKLDGKIALITGGSSGIGLATARRFVAEGAYVFITGRREAELNAAVKDIGKNIKALKGDVSHLGDLDRILSVIKQDKGDRTCARSRFRAGTVVLFIRWLGAAARRAGLSFCVMRRRRWPLAELRGRRGPHPDRHSSVISRTSARSKISAVHFIRWRDGAGRRAGFWPPFFLLNWPWPPSYGVAVDDCPIAAAWPRWGTSARSKILAVHFIRWRDGAGRRAGFGRRSFC